MKRILGCGALVVLLPLLALIILGLILPSNYSIDRSVTIDAPPEEIYASISDFKRWPEWVRFQAPGSQEETKFSFSGAASGTGSVLHWNSEDGAIGVGTFTMTEANPAKGISYAVSVESSKFEGTGSIHFQSVEAGTLVTWHDEGQLPPVTGGLLSWIYEAGTSARIEDDLARMKNMLESPEDAPTIDKSAAPTPGGG